MATVLKLYFRCAYFLWDYFSIVGTFCVEKITFLEDSITNKFVCLLNYSKITPLIYGQFMFRHWCVIGLTTSGVVLKSMHGSKVFE